MQPHTAGCIAATAGVAFASTAAAYTLAIHPGGLEAGPKAYTAFFGKMFPKIAKFQSALVVVGAGAAAVQAAKTPSHNLRSLWIASGALLASVVPWTVFKMMPVNNEIIAAADAGVEAKPEALKAWGPLHAVRLAASVASVGLMVYALSHTK